MTREHQILPGLLKPTRVRLADLVEDAKNARKHPKANIEAIKASLVQFGQHAPLVVQVPQNIIRIGNGTFRAMVELGWKQCAAVMVEEDDATAIARAIADNRTGDLSEFDEEILARLIDELGDATPVVGFDAEELERLGRKLAMSLEPGNASPGGDAGANAGAAPRTTGYTSMIHLFYAEEDKRTFERLAQELATMYGAENLSVTVLRALREAHAARQAQ